MIMSNGVHLEVMEIDALMLGNESQVMQAKNLLIFLMNSSEISNEKARIRLGNPSDTYYNNSQVDAIYLRSVKTIGGYCHYWINNSHKGELMISETFGETPERSTWGIQLSKLNLDDEIIQFYQQLLDQ